MLRDLKLFNTKATEVATRPAKPLPRTQDKVPVLAARDNLLILRDGGIIAAVGVGSLDDTLLPEPELHAKLAIYRDDLLKQLRFDVQLCIGTRPQNLDAYFDKLLNRADVLQVIETRLNAFEDGLASYIELRQWSAESFLAHFGFDVKQLVGTPGLAHDAARLLCDNSAKADPQLVETVAACVRGSIDLIVHWQDLIHHRAKFVEGLVGANQAPVRTVYFVTSYYVRLANKATAKLKGPLTESEIARATKELDHRCNQLQRGIERMKLKAWRATHDELVRDLQYFYHPSQSQLAHRELRAERSVAMGLARARV